MQIYTSILRIGCVAAGGVFVAGVFVLPTLAGDDLRLKLASIIGVSPLSHRLDILACRMTHLISLTSPTGLRSLLVR